VQRACDIRHHSLYLICRLRALPLEPFFRIVRRLCDQLLEKMPGDVLTTAKLLDENRIVLGAPDLVQNAKIRKTRTVVRCDRVHNLPIPSGHKHVRYVVTNRLSLGDRE
jgi:hypothetical protein